MCIGTPLDAQRCDQTVVHEPGELADGLISARGRFSINNQGVGEHGERDVPRRNETVGCCGNARQ